MVVALHLAGGRKCLVVGDLQTGYIVVPNSEMLRMELVERCIRTGRNPVDWIHTVQWRTASTWLTGEGVRKSRFSEIPADLAQPGDYGVSVGRNGRRGSS
jgi:hypothetical protein